jgi:hypothetical protein
METHQFDSFVRSLGRATYRRCLLFSLALSPFAGLVARQADNAVAKKRHKKKGTKKECPPCTKRKQGKCKGTLPDGSACRAGTCQSGRCVAAVPPDPCASCSGDQVCRDGVCIVPACGAGGPCRVFLSSVRYDGNLGGLSGADAKCQGLAAAAGLPGSYKAWLSDSTSAPISRFTPSSGPYRLLNGTTIAANWTELTDGTLAAPINVTETGGGVGEPARVWTHTRITGDAGGSPDAHCANWSTSTGVEGNWGIATVNLASWTDAGEASCTNPSHLYCFQQH